MNKYNKILVTGGAGFVGSNLCKRLVQDKNNYIFCLDNLYTGNLSNIKDIMNYDNFEFINHDIITSIDLLVDLIYNAACPASPSAYQMDPIFTTKTCIYGIINLLELAKKNDAKIMQFSTSEVYGEPLVHPQIETYRGNVNPIGIRSCYDEGKRCAESLCFDYNRQYGVKIKVIRIFNTYGPYMDKNDGRVISNFIVQALTGKDITIYGDGKQTRSFQYIDDLLDGILIMMNNTSDNFLGPVNIGNPSEFTMLQLADLVIRLTNSKSKIVFKDLPSDDPTRRKADISCAKINLKKWEPRVTLEEGLIKTIKYFKDQLGV